MKNNQATKEEVDAFLKEFKERAKLFDIVYVDSKPNNIDTLIALDITKNDRKNYVLSLDTEDYCQGPDKNDYPGQNDVWVFGKQIKGARGLHQNFHQCHTQPTQCVHFLPYFKI